MQATCLRKKKVNTSFKRQKYKYSIKTVSNTGRKNRVDKRLALKKQQGQKLNYWQVRDWLAHNKEWIWFGCSVTQSCQSMTRLLHIWGIIPEGSQAFPAVSKTPHKQTHAFQAYLQGRISATHQTFCSDTENQGKPFFLGFLWLDLSQNEIRLNWISAHENESVPGLPWRIVPTAVNVWK